MLRELPFGARISDSLVKKLKWETAKANEESPGALPCLYVQEIRSYENVRPNAARIEFTKCPEIAPINRLVPSTSPLVEIKKRVWVLKFGICKHSRETTFDIDGLELHISELAQAELKGATILVLSDNILVKYEPI